MGRTAMRAQDARARAREARWALLALEDRSAAQRAIAAALQKLAAENLRVQDIALLIGLTAGECSRLLRMPGNGTAPSVSEATADAVR